MTSTSQLETYFSVDIETAGPNPIQYSLLSIGACTIYEPHSTFYTELKPVNEAIDPAAHAVHRLNIQILFERGLSPLEAMTRFETWVEDQTPEGSTPVFVAFNAPFDWMFVNDYFHRYLGRNPFGHSALDIKAFYMGMAGISWEETSMRCLVARYSDTRKLTHHALQDAVDQARLFRNMLKEAGYFDNEPPS